MRHMLPPSWNPGEGVERLSLPASLPASSPSCLLGLLHAGLCVRRTLQMQRPVD